MEWYYVWWPWLTSKRVARVCQHQLSFLFSSCHALPFSTLGQTDGQNQWPSMHKTATMKNVPACTMYWKYDAFASNCDVSAELNQALMFIMSAIQFSLKATKYWWYCVAHFTSISPFLLLEFFLHKFSEERLAAAWSKKEKLPLSLMGRVVFRVPAAGTHLHLPIQVAFDKSFRMVNRINLTGAWLNQERRHALE